MDYSQSAKLRNPSSEYSPDRTGEGQTGTSRSDDNGSNTPPQRFRIRRPVAFNKSEIYREIHDTPRRVHILGTGSVGKLVAHSLKTVPGCPPVSLIFHKRQLCEEWRANGEAIKLTTDGLTEVQRGYDIEVAIPPEIEHGRITKPNSFMPNLPPRDPRIERELEGKPFVPSDQLSRPLDDLESNEPIFNLVVAVKAYQAVAALLAVRHRLSHHSTICFLQNGMGIIDEVNKQVFPDEDLRPSYMLGVVSHGVNTQSAFSATHAGQGTMQLGIIPRERRPWETFNQYQVPSEPAEEAASSTVYKPVYTDQTPISENMKRTTSRWPLSSRYLLRTLTRIPVLCAVGLTPPDLYVAQLEKLAINCIINPLTVLLDARNGAILFNFHITRVFRLLISEISLVFRSLPELQGTPNLKLKFSPDRIETLVVSAANATSENVSSMLADVRAGRQTEIEYINGYVVKRGEELGIRCAMNYMVEHLVWGKGQMVGREVREDVPMLGSEERTARNLDARNRDSRL
ncbi:MAG: hypothetical protein M1820_003702 [Bogoriella megaspora]|nr:MAG: hypothetical protein M1820_003702 [Bogoriella megaspora]